METKKQDQDQERYKDKEFYLLLSISELRKLIRFAKENKPIHLGKAKDYDTVILNVKETKKYEGQLNCIEVGTYGNSREMIRL